MGRDVLKRFVADLAAQIGPDRHLVGHLLQAVRLKWELECTHSIEDDAQRPDVGLERVRRGLVDLRRHVVRRAHLRHSRMQGVFHLLDAAEVTELDRPILAEEGVLSFDVAVQQMVLVHQFDDQADLGEPS